MRSVKAPKKQISKTKFEITQQYFRVLKVGCTEVKAMTNEMYIAVRLAASANVPQSCSDSNGNSSSNENTHSNHPQLTLLLILTMLTLLIQMPSNSQAAAIPAGSTATVLPPTAAATPRPLIPDTAYKRKQRPLANALDTLAPATHSGQRARHKRLRKRHNADLYLAKLSAASATSTALEWHNPCRGQYTPGDKSMPRLPKQTRSFYLKELRRTLRREYKTLKLTLHEIKTDDMKIWRKHATKYRFLPNLNRTRKFKPMHWHRGMQQYLASFIFLGTEQYRWDQRKHQMASGVSRELNSLVLSAQRVLCEIEMTYNGSYPHRRLHVISGENMQQRLNFYSKDVRRVAARGVDTIDLKYAKTYYFRYLKQMWVQLNKRLKSARLATAANANKDTPNSRISRSSSSLSSSEGNAASAALLDESFNLSATSQELSDSVELPTPA